MKKYLLLAGAALLALNTASQAADFLVDAQGHPNGMMISGPINDGDGARFYRALSDANATGNNDGFQLENSIFTTLGLGAAHAFNSAFFWSNTTGLAHDSNDHIIYNKTTGALYYDSNGNAAGGSVQIATLSNHAALTAADFTVI
jgi:Ca2+-binding RTX toxin-like protein